MLIIRRRRGESIIIGEDIEIEILETSPTQVKLGISAPKEVTVLRSEIRVTRDVNRAASSSDTNKLSQLVDQIREIEPNPETLPAKESAVVLPDETKPVTS